MTTPATDAVMDRIAKLLAMAAGNANENEAAIAAAKAAELLAEHNLTEAAIAARQSGKDDPIGQHSSTARTPDAWRAFLLSATARLYFCRIIVTGKEHTLIGREANAKVAIAMTEYLVATVKRMAREYSPDRRTQGDFRKACASRLCERLAQMYAEAMRAAAPKFKGGNPRNLPALYQTEADAVMAYMKDTYPALASAKARRMGIKDPYAAQAGHAAGDKVSLATQIAAERNPARLLG